MIAWWVCVIVLFAGLFVGYFVASLCCMASKTDLQLTIVGLQLELQRAQNAMQAVIVTGKANDGWS